MLRPGVEIDVRGELRALWLPVGELPAEHGGALVTGLDGDVVGAEPRLVRAHPGGFAAGDVEDAVAARELAPRPGREHVLVERERRQWKYWPPSITIVWPVTKSAVGPAR